MYSLFYLVFLVWKVSLVSVKSFFNYHKVSKRERRTTITLVWNDKKLQLNFKEFSKGFDEATVQDLKQKIKLMTDVPIASMKLQVSGANMKDDTATLSSLGVHKGSVITLNGNKVDESVVKQTASGNPEEYALMLRIAGVVDTVEKSIAVKLEEFERSLEQVKHKLSDTEKKKLQDQGIFLSEKIMQALISLDSVECPMGFDTARQRRREGVRLAQTLLERVDKARASAKEICKK
ncbi:BAG family molecular chaperone regulator 1 [Choanephora cucurbitarum]|uniref:BAG family molecular chaperone regulator 1 n=1 Tax=Choanephora cucurbitarum TaxID=101091 RepID=A0A1C7MZQ9_9FUNG|nr:BAG family molecular chaperone regulator 1 [Choanephora cucurbitarum]